MSVWAYRQTNTSTISIHYLTCMLKYCGKYQHIFDYLAMVSQVNWGHSTLPHSFSLNLVRYLLWRTRTWYVVQYVYRASEIHFTQHHKRNSNSSIIYHLWMRLVQLDLCCLRITCNMKFIWLVKSRIIDKATLKHDETGWAQLLASTQSSEYWKNY